MTSEISRRILCLVASGMELRAAFDAVLGAGSYDRLASAQVAHTTTPRGGDHQPTHNEENGR